MVARLAMALMEAEAGEAVPLITPIALMPVQLARPLSELASGAIGRVSIATMMGSPANEFAEVHLGLVSTG